MNQDNGRSYFGIALDNSQLKQDAEEAKRVLASIETSAYASGKEIDTAFHSSADGAKVLEGSLSTLGATLAATFGTGALLSFARSVIQVRADMQGLGASLTSLLGSGQKAQEMLSELTRFGADTPMDLSDLARASQTMLSFGIEGEKIIPLIKRLGDISGGSGEKLQSLALAFSQISSTGRLMGQDLNQMINAGFNPLSEIARTTGRSMAELKKDMEEGAISIDQVEGALRSATSAGGLFYGNLEGQSKTLRGQLGALSDAYEQMLNGIGEQTEGAIGTGISLATTAVENWQTLAKVIFAAAGAVGTYKAVLLATVALDKARAASAWVIEARQLEALIGVQGVAMVQKQGLTIGTQAYTLALRQQFVTQQAAIGVTVSEAQLTAISTASKATATAATGALSAAKATLTAVTTRLNAVLMANPYALAAAAVALLSYGIYELATYETEAEASARKLKEAHADATKEYEGEKLVLRDLYASLKEAKEASDDSTKSQKEHNEALATYAQKKEEFLKKAPQAVSALVKERLEVNDLAGAYKLLTDEVRKSIMARHREQAIKELGDSMFERNKETLLELRSQLAKAYGQDKGDDLFVKLRNAIEGGQKVNPAFIEKTMELLKPKMDPFHFRHVLNTLVKRNEELEKGIRDANVLFGDTPGETKKAQSKPLANFNEELADSNNKLKRLLDQRQKLLAGDASATMGKSFKEALGDVNKDIKETEETIATLMGKSKKGGRSGAGAKSNPNHEIAERKQRAIDLKLLDEKNLQDEQSRLLRQQEERVATMEEGWKKEEALMLLNAEKRKAAYRRLEQDLIEAQRTEARKQWEQSNPKAKDKGEVFDPTGIGAADLGERAQAMLAEQARIHREQELQEQEAHWKKLIEGAESYEQQRLRIREDYNRRIEALYVHDDMGTRVIYRKGVTADNEAELNRKYDEALSTLDLEIAQRSESFKAWMESIASLSLDQLSKALETAKAELAKLQSVPGVSSTDIVTAKARVDQLQKSLAKATAKDKLAPEKRSIKEWKDLADTIDKGAKSFDELGSAIGGAAGKLLRGVGSIATATFSAINSVVQLTQVSTGAMAATASGASAAMKTVEKASIILSIVTTALSVAQKIASLFNNDEEKDKQIQSLQRRIDSLQWEIDHASTIQLERSVSAFQNLSEAIEASRHQVGAYRGSLFDAGRIADHIAQQNSVAAQRIASVYEKVAYSANKVVGAEKYQSARSQIKAMAQQQIALSQQMDAERSKKKSDGGKIEEYKRKIQELGEKQAEVINKLTEDVLGGDFTKLASELGDAIASAFDRGSDAAEAFNAKVSDIIRDMVKKQLTEELLMKPMLGVFDKYKAKFTAAEFDPKKIIGMTSELSRDLKDIGDKVVPAYTAAMQEVQRQLRDTLGAGESNRQASKKGIATASQDSIDELNGRLTAIQGHTFSINEQARQLSATTGLILQSVVRIEGETNGFGSRLERMEKHLGRVSSTLDDISLSGIRIK